MGLRKDWPCSLQGPIDGVGVLERPICRELACYLASETDAGGEGAQGFALVPKA